MPEAREIAAIGVLLAGSHARRYDDPREMVYLAELARAAADALDPEEHGAALVSDTRARVWAELGNAYRVADALDLAEQAMEHAVDHYEEGTRDQALLAFISERTAILLWHRRRFEEALALLERVFQFHRNREEDESAARILLEQGFILEDQGDAEDAVRLTLQALALLSEKSPSSLRLAGVHNLLMTATGLGHFALVRRLFKDVRPLYEAGKERLNLLRLKWLEARVAAGLGEGQAAEAAFLGVRQGFLEVGLTFPASLASLDLARLWLGQERTSEIKALAGELIEAFRGLRTGREAIVALLLLRRACEEEGSALSKVREALETAAWQVQELSRRRG